MILYNTKRLVSTKWCCFKTLNIYLLCRIKLISRSLNYFQTHVMLYWTVHTKLNSVPYLYLLHFLRRIIWVALNYKAIIQTIHIRVTRPVHNVCNIRLTTHSMPLTPAQLVYTMLIIIFVRRYSLLCLLCHVRNLTIWGGNGL